MSIRCHFVEDTDARHRTPCTLANYLRGEKAREYLYTSWHIVGVFSMPICWRRYNSFLSRFAFCTVCAVFSFFIMIIIFLSCKWLLTTLLDYNEVYDYEIVCTNVREKFFTMTNVELCLM